MLCDIRCDLASLVATQTTVGKLNDERLRDILSCLRYVTLSYVTLSYGTLRYVMLCDVI